MSQILLNLLELRTNLYVTDFLDILITGLFIYSIFIFLKNSKNYLVFIGISFSVLLYLLATNFNLYVTLMTLRYFAGISVLVIVIVFQAEIRKYFELLGLIGTRQIKQDKKTPTAIEIIQACVKMAESKTGALIVIQGRDNIDRHIEGGTKLDGIISEEVLLSVFDPHSEGHDGALIINNNRITLFGSHLPLSTNFKEIGKHGTRHSAALGLSEVSDSLSIVVSEEKGQISLCRDGKMKTLKDYSELEKELAKYITSKFEEKSENWLHRIIKHNLKYKVSAMIVAFLVWFFMAYQAGIVEKTFEAELVFNKVPKDTIVQSYTPKSLKVSTRGRGEGSFANIDATDFVVQINAGNLQSGLNKIQIESKDISIPAGLSLVDFEPQTVLVSSEKYTKMEISVVAKTKGNTPKEVELKGVAVTPEKVEVLVPQGSEAPSEIATEVIDVSSQTEPIIVPVKIIIDEKFKLVDQADSTVNVALDIQKVENN